MNWIVARIKWIMIVSGFLTCTMLYAVIAPQAALRSTFGASLEGPLAEIIVRNWAALIVLTALMLIYGAYNPAVRTLAVIVSGLGKLIFILLVLIYGRQYLDQAALVIVVDLIIVILFVCYLIGRPQNHNAT